MKQKPHAQPTSANKLGLGAAFNGEINNIALGVG
jgi:hypothetical protein